MRLRIDRYPEGRVVRRGKITRDDICKKFRLPKDAVITITVPGGADWSGMEIELGNEFETIDVKTEEIK